MFFGVYFFINCDYQSLLTKYWRLALPFVLYSLLFLHAMKEMAKVQHFKSLGWVRLVNLRMWQTASISLSSSLLVKDVKSSCWCYLLTSPLRKPLDSYMWDTVLDFQPCLRNSCREKCGHSHSLLLHLPCQIHRYRGCKAFSYYLT